jgi:hypothetical protein
MAIEPRPKAEGAKPYGGAVAGPHVRWILERTLEEYAGVPPRVPATPPAEAAPPAPAGDGGAAAPALMRLRAEEDR